MSVAPILPPPDIGRAILDNEADYGMGRMGQGQAHRQSCLAQALTYDGVGVHSGKRARMTIQPAPANHGLVFHCADAPEGVESFTPALWSRAPAAELCTKLRVTRDLSVSTVEHVCAALAGMGVDNALVEVEGGEAPILDGSARAFAQDIVEVGLRRFDVERREIVILRPVRVSLGDSFAELAPGDDGLTLDVEIDFAHSAIGRQRFYGALSPEMFARELAGARTFGFVRDVERLWSLGLARGAGLENTIVLDEKRVMNDGGLRFADEFVRHKALDAVGDLALAGAPLRGAFRSRRSGHALNVAVLKALFADPKAWAIRGAAPLRRAPLRPDFGMRLAPTFAPVL